MMSGNPKALAVTWIVGREDDWYTIVPSKITRNVAVRADGATYFDARVQLEYELLQESMQSTFLAVLGRYGGREWYVGVLRTWEWSTRAREGQVDWREHIVDLPRWNVGYAFWHYPVGIITALSLADLRPWRDNRRLKRLAIELTEETAALRVAGALRQAAKDMTFFADSFITINGKQVKPRIVYHGGERQILVNP